MSPRAAVIANPSKVDLGRLRRSLPKYEQVYGWDSSLILETTPEDVGHGQTREALAAGVDLVIVVGGDGTVRVAVEQLAGTGIPLGIVPAGTGNLLARNLGLDAFSFARALHVAFNGHDRHIDLGQAEVERPEGEHETFVFAVISGIGVDAGMITHTDDDLKQRIGWPAYIGGILKWMIGSGAFNIRYRVGAGRTWGSRASSVMVGNCGLLTGGVRLIPDAELDDGKLDMVIMRPRGPMGWAAVGAGVIARGVAKQFRAISRRFKVRGPLGPRKLRVLSYYQDPELTFRIDSTPEPFQIDGDAVGEIVAARVTVLPESLTVRVAR
ncbi:diacylglycerol/lipid kinase family protein [Gulosibacter chungangensis]|uniref:DAGKc domain-containing protein n=1 Tax=Gulosibacter chungangensis TaxID=979746 RepID=A0A7J5BFF5_9MICO|nr:diacylglycerol kinase family protein [Gulosibacter chungangensis]KAB1645001.1 hypothetical protein F8O05_01725 [Gulosibacter chungangensis]